MSDILGEDFDLKKNILLIGQDFWFNCMYPFIFWDFLDNISDLFTYLKSFTKIEDIFGEVFCHTNINLTFWGPGGTVWDMETGGWPTQQAG